MFKRGDHKMQNQSSASFLEQIEVFETHRVLRSFGEPGSDANSSTECFLSQSLSSAPNRNTAYAFALVIRDQP